MFRHSAFWREIRLLIALVCLSQGWLGGELLSMILFVFITQCAVPHSISSFFLLFSNHSTSSLPPSSSSPRPLSHAHLYFRKQHPFACAWPVFIPNHSSPPTSRSTFSHANMIRLQQHHFACALPVFVVLFFPTILRSALAHVNMIRLKQHHFACSLPVFVSNFFFFTSSTITTTNTATSSPIGQDLNVKCLARPIATRVGYWES